MDDYGKMASSVRFQKADNQPGPAYSKYKKVLSELLQANLNWTHKEEIILKRMKSETAAAEKLFAEAVEKSTAKTNRDLSRIQGVEQSLTHRVRTINHRISKRVRDVSARLLSIKRADLLLSNSKASTLSQTPLSESDVTKSLEQLEALSAKSDWAADELVAEVDKYEHWQRVYRKVRKVVAIAAILATLFLLDYYSN